MLSAVNATRPRPRKAAKRDQHERAPQQAEGNQTTQHSASICPAIDSPQIGQRHCLEGNWAVRRMGMIWKEYAGPPLCRCRQQQRRSSRPSVPFVGAASGGPKVEKFFSYLTEK